MYIRGPQFYFCFNNFSQLLSLLVSLDALKIVPNPKMEKIQHNKMNNQPSMNYIEFHHTICGKN